MPPPYPYYAPSQEDEINLMDVWETLVEQKKLISIITTVITLIALTYALLATPIYRAEALLAPVAKEKGGRLGVFASQFGGLASLAGINLGGGGGSVAEAIATLKSREFTNNFIEDENLMPVLFEDGWDEGNQQWLNAEKSPTLWNAYKVFRSILTISQDEKTGLVTLYVEWKDPVLAAKWVGMLVTRLNKQLRNEAILTSEKSIKYLQAELLRTSVLEIKESIYSLIEAQTKTKMLANTQDEYVFRVLDRPVVPEERIKPKRSVIVILGFVLGGMMGVFIGFFRSFMTKK